MVIAVDFDGTICQNRFPHIGPEVPGVFEWLHKFQDAGAKLILWTIRCNDKFVPKYATCLTDAIEFCSQHGIQFFGINKNPHMSTDSPKVYVNLHIDDKAYGCPLVRDSEGQNMVDWSMVGPNVLIKIYERSARSQELGI